jgi:hypothetical protein
LKIDHGLLARESTLTTEEEPMTKRIYRGVLAVTAVAALVGFPLFSGLAIAADKHVAEALAHAKDAVSHGKEGHADALVQHAEEALKHAMAGDMKNPHVAEGITHLKEAISHGKAGHADVGTQHAEGAVTHLSEVK